ncbi:hypothetical protein J3458_006868 [Metarhizium acridum]|uniref:SSCRP protein n=1 Tax=Metarhizium acridum (strain CQMa 102) TaxID=655827 RepID=E9E905_METAQ|nr:uncharacterized protein MAC_06353 [Metarhizium acridum CQMa 102]EFY87641.1 hypothetical protein MAC_06353 [Metarhizium acridum CQMa 102]KAG8416272.1 hypothetical protein J3458_006868 [Metarhizium acridum]
MYSNIIIVAVAAAALLAPSSALTMRNKHVGDFRLFSHQGCFDGNLGVWTVIDDDVAHQPCQPMNDIAVHSVNVNAVNGACKFSLYEDADCKAGGQNTTQGNCYNSAAGWKAWKMTC